MRTAVAGVVMIVIVAAAALPAGAGPRTHLVRPGESVYRIALRYGVSLEALVRANEIADPARIRVGQRLLIPGQTRAGTGRDVSGRTPRPDARPISRYTVQRGDTLIGIARRHGTSLRALMDANGLRTDRIHAGQSLRIPASAPSSPAGAVPGVPTETGPVSAPDVGSRVTVPRPQRVRRGPKRYHTTLAIVAGGTPLRVLDTADGWIQVELPDGEPGWLPVQAFQAMPLPQQVESASLHGADFARDALRYLGTPYVWGGQSTRGVDCSGFVYVVFSGRRSELGRMRSFDYYQIGRPVDRADLRPGDLVFFRTYAPGPSHVGIYTGGGRFVHASSGARRVVITPLDDAYYAARYLGARRLHNP